MAGLKTSAMPNAYFRFKRFTVHHSGSAMKVGTDGVLLGAWARLDGNEKRILDIGTGSGLIALMLAQRVAEAAVDAVEIDPEAVRQAEENVQASPWPERIHIYNGSIQDFARQTTERYDHVITNPPFFVDSLKAPDASRSAARHTDTLSFEELIGAVLTLLRPDGRFSVIYPLEQGAVFEEKARQSGLYCARKTRVWGMPEVSPKRVLMEFSYTDREVVEHALVIESARHEYTGEYKKLTKDFYLKF